MDSDVCNSTVYYMCSQLAIYLSMTAMQSDIDEMWQADVSAA